MENNTTFTSILFILITLITVWLFYRTTNQSKTTLIILFAWMLVQIVPALNGFYRQPGMPPRFIFLIGPAVIFIIGLFVTNKGRIFLDSLNIKKLTLLHTIRIVVEIILFLMFTSKLVPQLMTFEGRNLDILSGITAPLIYFVVFVTKKAGRKTLLAWNIICLGLLINIVTIALLSAPSPFQRLAFEQPNIGITYFPFVWLPSVVVPLVFLSHLAAIRQLIHHKK